METCASAHQSRIRVILKRRNLGPLVQRVGNQARKILIVSVDVVIVCKAKGSLGDLSPKTRPRLGVSALISLRRDNSFSYGLPKGLAQTFRNLLFGLGFGLPVTRGLRGLADGCHG